MSIMVALTAGPLAAVNTRRAGSSLPPMPSGCISRDGLPSAMEGQTSSMWAPSTFMPAWVQVVGVVFHERGAARQAGGHHLHGAHQRGGLPVALGAEAVAVRHQALDGEAGELRQAVQVLEGRREGAEAAVLEEAAHAQLDARRLPQRSGAGPARRSSLATAYRASYSDDQPRLISASRHLLHARPRGRRRRSRCTA